MWLHADDMLEIISRNTPCLETDTIEGFLKEDVGNEKAPNLTVTSAFDTILQRWVPVTITVLSGKSALDYNISLFALRR